MWERFRRWVAGWTPRSEARRLRAHAAIQRSETARLRALSQYYEVMTLRGKK